MAMGLPTILTEKDKKEIIELYRSGESLTFLMREFHTNYKKIKEVLVGVEMPEDRRIVARRKQTKQAVTPTTRIKKKPVIPYSDKLKRTPVYECTCGLWKRIELAGENDTCVCGLKMKSTTRMVKPLLTGEQAFERIHSPNNNYIRKKHPDDSFIICPSHFNTQ